MSRFDAGWLRLREPFDLAARDGGLAGRFGAALRVERHGTHRIVDLAAGTGAGFRALAPLLGGDQDWLLVDHDPLLIAEQSAEITRWALCNGWRCRALDGQVEVEGATGRWRARAHTLDLALDLEALDSSACDGVITTAFLDLVSAAWIDRLCSLLEKRRLPLLAALTVDGRRRWRPALPADASIDEGFRRHQSTDKGFGKALGAAAAEYLADRLAQLGYEVSVAPSDWCIGAGEPDMLLPLIDESAAAATEMQPAQATVLADWATVRRMQACSGVLALDVGHADVLAIASQ
ncbi:MAG: hypothetical protein QOG42_2165 [Solirubrobacteraceae bacterium]|nr:hypothetical protein [Solirubrobacteraceae bacterium]